MVVKEEIGEIFPGPHIGNGSRDYICFNVLFVYFFKINYKIWITGESKTTNVHMNLLNILLPLSSFSTNFPYYWQEYLSIP
jgi:hypothetical protein